MGQSVVPSSDGLTVVHTVMMKGEGDAPTLGQIAMLRQHAPEDARLSLSGAGVTGEPDKSTWTASLTWESPLDKPSTGAIPAPFAHTHTTGCRCAVKPDHLRGMSPQQRGMLEAQVDAIESTHGFVAPRNLADSAAYASGGIIRRPGDRGSAWRTAERTGVERVIHPKDASEQRSVLEPQDARRLTPAEEAASDEAQAQEQQIREGLIAEHEQIGKDWEARQNAKDYRASSWTLGIKPMSDEEARLRQNLSEAIGRTRASTQKPSTPRVLQERVEATAAERKADRELQAYLRSQKPAEQEEQPAETVAEKPMSKEEVADLAEYHKQVPWQ